MSDQQNEGESGGALPEHVENLPAFPTHRCEFDLLICRFVGVKPTFGRDGKRDGRRKAMVDALNGEATYVQIREWRRGRIAPPAWALKLLQDKLSSRRDHYESLRSLNSMIKPGRGLGWRRSA